MDKRIKKTKQAITEAYFSLLSEHKDGKVTISEIARKADIDRKTFYLHYQDTDDIIKEFCKEKVFQYIEKLDYINNAPRTFSVAQLFEILNSIISENVEILAIISKRKENNSFFQVIKEILYEAVWFNLREPLGLPDTELTVYTEFYISAIIAVYQLWVQEKLPITIENLSQMVTNASLKGLEFITQKH